MELIITFCLLARGVGGEEERLFKSRIKEVSVSSDSLVLPAVQLVTTDYDY